MRYLVPAFVLLVLAAVGAWWALAPRNPSVPPADQPADPGPAKVPSPVSQPDLTLPEGVKINFVDATASAGIDFKHIDGRTEVEYLMDSTGPGAAWIDYDQDGLLDLFLVQGSTVLPPHPTAGSKLYRNLGGG